MVHKMTCLSTVKWHLFKLSFLIFWQLPLCGWVHVPRICLFMCSIMCAWKAQNALLNGFVAPHLSIPLDNNLWTISPPILISICNMQGTAWSSNNFTLSLFFSLLLSTFASSSNLSSMYKADCSHSCWSPKLPCIDKRQSSSSQSSSILNCLLHWVHLFSGALSVS